MNQTVWKYESGDKKSIFGRPYTYNGTKWIPDDGGSQTGPDGKKQKKMSVPEVDKYLKSEGLEHITELDPQIVKRLLKSKGIDYARKTPQQMLDELVKIYGAGSGTKKEEKPKEEKPKEEKPKEEKPKEEKHTTPSSWKDATDKVEARDAFRKVAPGFDLVGERASVKDFNRVGSIISGLSDRSPRIKKILENHVYKYRSSFHVSNEKDIKKLSHRNPNKSQMTFGTYNKSDGKITVGSGSGRPNHLMIGNTGNIGNANIHSLINHEFGHHVYYSDPSVAKEFNRVYESLPKLREATWKHPISMYAGTSESECFAECFAAYFHPDYNASSGKKTKGLPKELHKLFEDLFK